MSKYLSRKAHRIDPDMTVLDVVHRFRQTEGVFRKYDQQIGACICCDALFEPLRIMAERYGLDLEILLAELEAIIVSCSD